MITPLEIKKQAEKWFPDFLSHSFSGLSFFPKEVRFGKLKAIDAVKNFEKTRQQLYDLRQNSKELKGFGYTIEYKTTDSRKIGRNSLPSRIIFENESDYLRFISREKDFRWFSENSALIKSQIPELHDWIKANPIKVLEHNGLWNGLVEVCLYFMRNPKPGIYLREIPVSLHTKFIEENKALLRELLEILIPRDINTNETVFEKRFSLRIREPLIRFRVLDDTLADKHFSGLKDISIPASDFSCLKTGCSRVIIIENKTSFSNIYNFLCLPKMKNTIAIFGSGFSAGNLKDALWLNDIEILYWGDIDAHGFMILSQLRSYFPHVRSILMDMETFKEFAEFRVEGSPAAYCELQSLNPQEKELYNYLFTIPDNRLEQERISQTYLLQKLK